MKLVVAGATGFSGHEVTKQALADPEIETVLVLVRRPTGITHPKLEEVVLRNFLDYSEVDLSGYGACIWCLGISELQVGKDEYIRITHDYPVAAARALLRASPEARLCLLSGRHADPTESGRRLFTRIKGRAEKSLTALTANAYHFRPGYIRPTAASGPRRDFARFLAPIGRLLALVSDDLSVDCDGLARALLRVAKHGAPTRVFENGEIRALGAA